MRRALLRSVSNKVGCGTARPQQRRADPEASGFLLLDRLLHAERRLAIHERAQLIHSEFSVVVRPPGER
jgi:hypothetical protein